MKGLLTILFAFAFAATPTDAQAQVDWPGPRVGEILTAEELAYSLSAKRGLAISTTETPTITLGLRFGFDSSDLDARARQILDEVGKALSYSSLRNLKFLIVGHTDAVGAESFNLELSRRRAETVRDYLVNNLRIDPDRLVAVGRGESDLLDRLQPDSPANRRIEIVNVGSR